MKTLGLFVLFALAACTDPGEKTESVPPISPGALPLTSEFEFSLPTACVETGGDFKIKKLKKDPCLSIDSFHVCTLRWAKKGPKRKVELAVGMPNPPRFGAFSETKRTETLKVYKKPDEKRDTCDLEFDVEWEGRTQRCYFNRHLKDPDIHCR